MMKTIKKKMSVWKMAAIAPTVIGFFFLVACNDRVAAQNTAEKAKQSAVSKSDEVFNITDEPASFPGGMEALAVYLAKEIRYPEKAKKDKIDGKVYAEFTVETDGSISNIKVLKGLDENCDAETVRVIRSLPKWIPGKQAGRIVRSKMVLPVIFSTKL